MYATERPGQFASRCVSNLNNKDMLLESDGSLEVRSGYLMEVKSREVLLVFIPRVTLESHSVEFRSH